MIVGVVESGRELALFSPAIIQTWVTGSVRLMCSGAIEAGVMAWRGRGQSYGTTSSSEAADKQEERREAGRMTCTAQMSNDLLTIADVVMHNHWPTSNL